MKSKITFTLEPIEDANYQRQQYELRKDVMVTHQSRQNPKSRMIFKCCKLLFEALDVHKVDENFFNISKIEQNMIKINDLLKNRENPALPGQIMSNKHLCNEWKIKLMRHGQFIYNQLEYICNFLKSLKHDL